MQAYGGWSSDPDYGEVWSPNTVPDGWQPYSTGSWAYSQPYGWTWVDEQPWGFAPYHYGRWANRNNRWFWVPPEHGQHAVYAPALVAFIGGAELGVAIGNAGAGPVGWFPLGPREAYVPPYTNNRAYYDRINTDAHVDRAVMNDRWQRAENHQAITANDPNEHMANRRFTTVVPAQAFVSSQRVERAAIKVSADKLASAPIAAVSAPPAPAQGNTPKADTRFNGVQQIGRPTAAQRHETAGPKVAEHTAPPAPGAKAAPPPLEPRRGAAPPVIQGERTPAQQPNAAQPNKPGEPNRPPEANRAEPPKPGQPATPQAQQANRPEPPKPGEPARPAEAHPPAQPAHQAEAPRAPAPQASHAEPQHEAPRPAETHAAAPPLVHPSAEPPRAPAQHPAAEVARPAAPAPQPQHVQAPPQQAQAPHPAAPPPQAPHPAAAPAPAPHPAAPAPAAHKEEEKK
jgi:hypothetical protein